MGQVKCKTCSIGTYVSAELHPGKSPTDCQACPYGEENDIKMHALFLTKSLDLPVYSMSSDGDLWNYL